MNHSTLPGYDFHVVAPIRHAMLACRFLKPSDFKVSTLPDECLDFARRAAFLPLVVTLTPKGPLVFSVAARPAQANGIVSHWLEQVCRLEGFQRDPIREVCFGRCPGVTCDALQACDGAVMKMRLVMMEDGGRLFQITAIAPEPLWAPALVRFAPMFESFEILEPRGATVRLFPDGEWSRTDDQVPRGTASG